MTHCHVVIILLISAVASCYADIPPDVPLQDGMEPQLYELTNKEPLLFRAAPSSPAFSVRTASSSSPTSSLRVPTPRLSAATNQAFRDAINWMRATPLPPVGGAFFNYMATHPRNLVPMTYLATGQGSPDPAAKPALDVLRQGIAQGAIDWVQWRDAGGLDWAQFTALLSLYMVSYLFFAPISTNHYHSILSHAHLPCLCLQTTKDPRYPSTFFAIANDYCLNHKRQLFAAQGYTLGTTSNMDVYWKGTAEYSRNAGWTLGQTGVISQIVLLLAGFHKVQQDFAFPLPMNATSAWASLWTTAAFMWRQYPPLLPSTDPMIQEAQFWNIVRGLLVDHTDYLIVSYVPSGRVPNQRFSGVTALTQVGYVFKDYVYAIDGAIRYTYAVNNQNVTLSTLVDIASNTYVQGTTGVSSIVSDECWPDGAILERSVNYNQGEVRGFLYMQPLMPSAAEQARLDAVVQQYRAWENGLKMPNGNIPAIGNSPPTGYAPTTFFVRPELNVQNMTAPTASVLFPYSGYAALRFRRTPSSNSNVSIVNNDEYMFMNYGLPSRGHQVSSVHYLAYFGVDRVLLSTGGDPTYGFYPDVNKGKSTFVDEPCSYKATGWIVDGLNVQQVYTYPPNNWTAVTKVSQNKLASRFLSGGVAFDVVEHSFFVKFGGLYGASLTPVVPATQPGVTVQMQRMVIANKEDSVWFVVDRMTPMSNDTSAHEYRLPWILPQDFQAQDDVLLTSKGLSTRKFNSTNVFIQHTYINSSSSGSSTSVRMELYYGQYSSESPIRTSGSTNSGIRTDLGPLGWSSPGIGTVNAAPNVHSVVGGVTGVVTLVTSIQSVPNGGSVNAMSAACIEQQTTTFSGIVCNTTSGYQLQVSWDGSTGIAQQRDGVWRTIPKKMRVEKLNVADAAALRPPTY